MAHSPPFHDVPIRCIMFFCGCIHKKRLGRNVGNKDNNSYSINFRSSFASRSRARLHHTWNVPSSLRKNTSPPSLALEPQLLPPVSWLVHCGTELPCTLHRLLPLVLSVSVLVQLRPTTNKIALTFTQQLLRTNEKYKSKTKTDHCITNLFQHR